MSVSDFLHTVASMFTAVVFSIGLPRVRSTLAHMIEITAEPKAKIPVVLVGVEYKIQPPKSALALKLAVRSKTAGDNPELLVATLDEWIEKAFGKTEARKVQKRLEDEGDALDYEHISALMEAIIEATSGGETPTT